MCLLESGMESHKDLNLGRKDRGKDISVYVHIHFVLLYLEARNKGGRRLGDGEDRINMCH